MLGHLHHVHEFVPANLAIVAEVAVVEQHLQCSFVALAHLAKVFDGNETGRVFVEDIKCLEDIPIPQRNLFREKQGQ